MSKAILFVKEAYSELMKATWLSRKEVIQSTMLVILIVILAAAYVNSVDFILNTILKQILGAR